MLKWLKRQILIWRVNKTLKIKLRKDQIDYIFFGKSYILQGRRNGKTLSYILKILLNGGTYHIADIKPDEKSLNVEYRQFFRRWFREIYFKLNSRGLVKCVIYGF